MKAIQEDTSLSASAPRFTSSRVRASDWVFDDLAERICKVDLVPGASISESELAAHYGVSRTPVRAAIASLADNDLVRVRPQVGTRVSLIDLDEVAQAQFIRESLETNALRYACEADDRDFSVIEATIAEQHRIAKTGDPEAFFLADEAFHRQTFELAGYGGAWSVVGRRRFQLDRIRRLSIRPPQPHKLEELCYEHEEIVQHILNRDTERAVEKLRIHIRRYIIDSPALRQAYPSYFVGKRFGPAEFVKVNEASVSLGG